MLSSLARKEVFGVQADPRSPEHGQYGFLQDLLRKVAYETLAKADRKARHLAAAAYLEQALASSRRSSRSSPPTTSPPTRPRPTPTTRPRSGRRPRAELARAGERAASLGANEEAERYFAQAAELADDPLGEAELRRAGRAGRPGAARAATEARATSTGRSPSSRPRA